MYLFVILAPLLLFFSSIKLFSPNLQIMKSLRHSSSIRQDFDTTRTSLMTWLREVDTTLSNLLELKSLDLDTKVNEIRVSFWNVWINKNKSWSRTWFMVVSEYFILTFKDSHLSFQSNLENQVHHCLWTEEIIGFLLGFTSHPSQIWSAKQIVRNLFYILFLPFSE